MRNLTIVGIVLVLLLGTSALSYAYISGSAHGLSVQLDRVEQMVEQGKWAEAGSNLQTAQNSWEKTKYWWTILLNHQEIDNIDISLSRLREYITTRGLSLSLGELSALKMLVGHVADNEVVNVRNVL